MVPRRIAYSLNVFPKVSETFIANELAEVRRRGVEVLILSHTRPNETLRHPIVEEAGLLDRARYAEERFLTELKRFRPDLIHAHFATRPTESARSWARELGIPYTFTAHGYDVYSRPPQDFAARAAEAAAFITVSNRNADHIREQFGVDAQHINVVPCGVDLHLFRPRANPNPSLPLILCVARLHPAKNLPVLLKACALLRELGFRFRCVIIGEGDKRPELEALQIELELQETVHLIGARDQQRVRRWWQRATVGVLTSEREGMPVSLMEAMACGVPIVAPRVGGIPEMIEDGVTGFLTTPGDVYSTAEALRSVLDDPLRANDMGHAARNRAELCFSLDRQVGKLINIWSRALEQRDVA